ncbi:MAG TPA: autotransporter outer membrane beta-barrel domain-containing protein, partial [Phenylobacterium sp.]
PGTGAFSRVVVNGTDGRLTAGGVLAPRLRGITGAASNTYSPAIGRQFRVISAAGGIAADSGFSGLTQPAGLMAGARFDALYAPTSLSLIVTPTAYADLGSAGIAATPNQTAVGASLDASRPAAGLRMSVDRASVYYPLYGLSATELPAGLEALSPDIYAAGVMAVRQAWSQGAAAVGDQLAGRRGAPGSPAASSEGVTLWADAFGQRTEFGGSGAAARTSVGGVIFGIDRTFGSGVAGIAVGIDDVRTDAAGGDSADGTLFQAVVYGGARRGRAFVDWQADYLRMDQDVTRSGGRFGASAKGGDTLEGAGGQINTGLGFTARRWRIEPTVGLSLLRLTSTATTESGGATTASIAGQRNHSLQSFAGVRLARMVRLTPDLSLQMRGLFGWSHEMEDVNAEARASLVRLGGPAFTVTSAPTGRDAAKLGASFSGQLTARVTVYGAYAAELAHDREAQQVSVGLRARW